MVLNKANRYQIIFVALAAMLVSPVATGFVLLSGPSEARLDISLDRPQIEFLVGGNVPKIKGKADFLGGKYRELSTEEFWYALLREAAKPWNDVTTSYAEIVINTTAEAVADGDDHQHSIVINSMNLTSGAFASPKIKNGEIVDCDITVNKNNINATALAFTIMHEFGHCLGLGHNHSNSSSVMSYAHPSSSLKLGIDDRAGITYLYPISGLGPARETLGCGVLAQHEGALEFWWLCLSLGLLPLIGVVGFPRRS